MDELVFQETSESMPGLIRIMIQCSNFKLICQMRYFHPKLSMQQRKQAFPRLKRIKSSQEKQDTPSQNAMEDESLLIILFQIFMLPQAMNVMLFLMCILLIIDFIGMKHLVEMW